MKKQDLRATLNSIEQALALLEREPVPGDFERKTLAELRRIRDEITRQCPRDGNTTGGR